MRKKIAAMLCILMLFSITYIPAFAADVFRAVYFDDFERQSYMAGDEAGDDKNPMGTVITQSEAAAIAPGTSSGQVVLFPENGGILSYRIPESHGAPYTGNVVRVTHNLYMPTMPAGSVMPIYFYSSAGSDGSINTITPIRITAAMALQYHNGTTYVTLSGSSVKLGWNTIGIELIKETPGADKPFTKARFYLNDNWYEPSGKTLRYVVPNFVEMAWQYPAGIAPMIDEIKVETTAAEIPNLTAVQNAALSPNGVVTFETSANDNARAYSVMLYKDEKFFSTATLLREEVKTVDLAEDVIRGGSGTYTAKVQAKGDWISYRDSDVRDATGSCSPESIADSNNPPTVVRPIPNQIGEVRKAVTLSLAGVFTDPDGDALVLSADKGMIYGTTFIYVPNTSGNITVTITADDGKGGQTSTSFVVAVEGHGDPELPWHEDFSDFAKGVQTLGQSVIGVDSQRQAGIFYTTDSVPADGDYQVAVLEPEDAGYMTGADGKMAELSFADTIDGRLIYAFPKADGDEVTIEMRLYLYPHPIGSQSIYINDAASFIQLTQGDTSGNLRYRNGSTYTILTPWTLGWHTLKLVFSKENSATFNAVEYHWDGTPLPTSGSSINKSSFRELSDIQFHIPDGKIGVDYIKVESRDHVPLPPNAINIRITKDTQNSSLKGVYTYASSQFKEEGASIYRWYASDTENGNYVQIEGVQSATLKLEEGLANKWYKFEVTPVDERNLAGETVQSPPYKPMFAPTVTNVYYLEDGGKLTGYYTYSSLNGEPEGDSIYQWYISSSANGYYARIPNATERIFVPTPNQMAQYIKLEVTPVSASGMVGEPVLSVASSGVTGGKDSDVARAAAELLFSHISREKNDRVTQNLNLPDRGNYDTHVRWSSDNSNIVSNTGVVTRPEYGPDRFVTLTAIFTKGGENYSVSFKMIVSSKDPSASGKPAVSDTRLYYSAKDGKSRGASVFTDVTDSHWAKVYVEYLYTIGAVKGVSQELFAPERTVTREEFCAVITRLFGLTTTNAPSFQDVPAESWYYSSVAAAADSGIVMGIDGNVFGTGKGITRQDAVIIMTRLAKHMGIALPQGDEAVSFKDIDEIAPYAEEAVSKFSEAGILSGGDDGYFRPNHTLRRGEMTKIIYSVYALKK